jgi:hypothetical protein
MLVTRPVLCGAGTAFPVPVQTLPMLAKLWGGCGRGEPSPGADVADVAEVRPVPVPMWQGCAQSRTFGRIGLMDGERHVLGESVEDQRGARLRRLVQRSHGAHDRLRLCK